MIKYCLACGCKMNSKTDGWECPNCNCYQDTSGNFHSSIFEKRSLNMTNADKIRSMTDEELANYLCEIIDCEVCKSFIIKNEVCNCKNGFPQGILEWLKRSVGGQ